MNVFHRFKLVCNLSQRRVDSNVRLKIMSREKEPDSKDARQRPSGCAAVVVVAVSVGLGFYNLFQSFGYSFNATSYLHSEMILTNAVLWILNPFGMAGLSITNPDGDRFYLAISLYLVGLAFSAYLWARIVGALRGR